jgi:hypothetical protein
MLGYVAMFFVLLYGWDGLGYDRFLYDRDMHGGAAWTPGAGLAAGASFLVSTVARTLYLDGAYLLPPLLWTIGRWQRDEARRTRGPARSILGWAGLHLAMVLGCALGAAALAALAVHALAVRLAGAPGGHVLAYAGLPLALALQWALLYAPGRPLRRALARALGLRG